MLYTTAVICGVFMIVMQIFFGAKINNLKMNIEYVNDEIDNENKKIESLTMKFNELTSYVGFISDSLDKLNLLYHTVSIPSLIPPNISFSKSQDFSIEQPAALACHHHQKLDAISLQLYFHFQRKLIFIQSSFSFHKITKF